MLQSRLVEQKEKLMYLQREHEKLANEHEKIEKQIWSLSNRDVVAIYLLVKEEVWKGGGTGGVSDCGHKRKGKCVGWARVKVFCDLEPKDLLGVAVKQKGDRKSWRDSNRKCEMWGLFYSTTGLFLCYPINKLEFKENGHCVSIMNESHKELVFYSTTGLNLFLTDK